MGLKKRRLLRIFIPRFPNFNIYTYIARTTTSVGPLFVATCAAKIDCWDAEVIDENNLHGRYYPRLKRGILDHQVLQKEDPADVIGFYGSITSSIPRLYELALYYQKMGITTIAGGKHVEHLPEEALKNGIDYVFFGESEKSIREFLIHFEDEVKRNSVKGIGYMNNGSVVSTPNQSQIMDLNRLPIPDYHLLRFGKIKLYPIVGTRGCNSNCEFCTVKDRARNCSAQYRMKIIRSLVEQYNAKHFFDVSDHFASNMEQAIEFLNKFAAYQKSLNRKLFLSVQTRITDARNQDYLDAIKDAQLEALCIGFESPIDEDLKAMRKGYLSKDMLKWTKLFKQQNTRIHGMFIYGYPNKIESSSLTHLDNYMDHFWNFIRKSKIDTLQILLAIPLPGTELRRRLESNKQLFSIKEIGWEYYDGQFPLYFPTNGNTPIETLKTSRTIMKRFYRRSYFFYLIKNVIIDFSLIVIPSAFTIISGNARMIKRAFYFWKRKFFIKNILRFSGQLILNNWIKKFKKSDFLKKLRRLQRSHSSPRNIS